MDCDHNMYFFCFSCFSFRFFGHILKKYIDKCKQKLFFVPFPFKSCGWFRTTPGLGHMINKMAAPLSRFGVRSLSNSFTRLTVNISKNKETNTCNRHVLANSEAICRCINVSNVRQNTIRSYTTRHDRKCWKCDAKTNEKAELFFCNCGVVQKVPSDLSFFDAMECPEEFDIDPAKLAEVYKERQKNLHPDKFSQKSEVCLAKK